MSERYACFSDEQQAIFDSYNEKQQRYVLLRSNGYSVKDSYTMAGYKGKNVYQNALAFENREHPESKELISALKDMKISTDLLLLDEKATREDIELALVNKKDIGVEDAKRIKFYRQVVEGTIKNVKVTNVYDRDGNLKERKVEESSSIDDRLKARRELDRILGINDILELGKINAGGNINITIVDASKRDNEVDIQGEVGNVGENK